MMIGNNVENVIALSTYEDDDVLIQTPVPMNIEGESVDPNYPAHLSTLDDSLWLKIYENILTDLDWENKHHFALSCRFFKGIFDSDKFMQSFACRLPYIVDAPAADRANAVAYRKGPLARFLREPEYEELYIPWYVRNGLLFGYDFDEIIRKLRGKIERVRSKQLEPIIERKEHWIKAVQNAHQHDYPEDFNWDDMPFGEFLTCAAAAGNLRAMVGLLDQKHLANVTITGLRLAVMLYNRDLLSMLFAKRKEAYNLRCANIHSSRATKEEIETLKREGKLLGDLEDPIAQYDLPVIKKILNISLSYGIIACFLESHHFQRQIQTWQYDDIFQSMKPETFTMLQNLSLNLPSFTLGVFRNMRTDLVRLINIFHSSQDCIVANLLADQYLALTEKLESMDSRHLDFQEQLESNRIREFIIIVHSNKNIINFIYSSPVMFHRALNNRNAIFINKSLSDPDQLSTKMHWALNEDQQKTIFAFVREHYHELIVKFLDHISDFPEKMLYRFATDEPRGSIFWNILSSQMDDEDMYPGIKKLLLDAVKENNMGIVESVVNASQYRNEEMRSKLASCLIESLQPHNKSDFSQFEKQICRLIGLPGRVLKQNISKDALIVLFKFASVDTLIRFIEYCLPRYIHLGHSLITLTEIVRDRNNRRLKNNFLNTVVEYNLTERLFTDDQITWLKMIPKDLAKKTITQTPRILSHAVLSEKLGSEHSLTKYVEENQGWINLHLATSDRKLPNPKKRK